MYLHQIARYWDTRAEGYSINIRKELAGNERDMFAKILKSSAPPGKALKCLDLGCGPGFFSILLAREGHDVTAVDYSERMLEKAKENFAEAGVAVNTVRGDVQALPFDDDSFDYLVSRNLVWNLEHPAEAYAEWVRVLKPGGRILVVDANHYLHYYDTAYQVLRETAVRAHHCHGVDPTPINNIARDLPLSKEHRPMWDVKTLLSLGMKHLHVSVSHRSGTDPETGKERTLITDFVVCAEKPRGGGLSGKEEQELINEYWSERAENYSRIVNEELSSPYSAAWAEKILSNAPEKKVLDILDAGCGPGFFSILLGKAGHRVIGVDGSRDMLRHARINAVKYGVYPLLIKADCHELPFPDASFDLVVSRNVTHILRDHGKVYAEWNRVLRPGGVLLVFDANWHLMQTDINVRRAFVRRERECIERFGSNFTGGKREIEDDEVEIVRSHRLGQVHRPDWDVPLLQRAGFTQIHCEKNIIEDLWDEKRKLLYGETPAFMIKAVKG